MRGKRNWGKKEEKGKGKQRKRGLSGGRDWGEGGGGRKKGKEEEVGNRG